MRKRYIALNILFFGWLALAVIGAAIDARTLGDRVETRNAAYLESIGQ